MSAYLTSNARDYVRRALAEVEEDVIDCVEKNHAVLKLKEADLWLGALLEAQRDAELDEDD